MAEPPERLDEETSCEHQTESLTDDLLAQVFRLRASPACPCDSCGGYERLRNVFCNFLRSSCAEDLKLPAARDSLLFAADVLSDRVASVEVHWAAMQREVRVTVQDSAGLREPPTFVIQVQPDGTWKKSRGSEALLLAAVDDEPKHSTQSLDARHIVDARTWSAGWAALKAATKFVLRHVCNHDFPHLYKVALAMFCLKELECFAASLDDGTSTPRRLAMASEMLQTTAKKVAKVVELGEAPDQAVERVLAVRRTLESVETARLAITAEKFALWPHGTRSRELVDAKIQLPDAALAPPAPLEAEDASTSAEVNLEPLVVGPEEPAILQVHGMLSQLKAPFDQHIDRHAAQLAIHQADAYFHRRMQELAEGEHATSCEHIEKLPVLLEEYLKVSRGLLPLLESHSQVERRSHEVLVTWIGFCLSHDLAKDTHPELLDYGVGLDPNDMDVLVLRDKTSIDAVRNLHSYLTKYAMPDRAIFTRNDEGPTHDFGEEVARGSGNLLDRWMAEDADAKRRVEAHWDEVERKQAEAARLRKRIEPLAREEARLVRSLSAVQSLEDKCDRAQKNVSSTKRKIQDLEKLLAGTSANSKRSKERELRTEQANLAEEQDSVSSAAKALEKEPRRRVLETQLQDVRERLQAERRALGEAEEPPAAVLQPLPNTKCKALQVLFFLYMPPRLRLLARMTFLAQQMLLPWPCCAGIGHSHGDALEKAIKEEDLAGSWVEYYNEQAGDTRYANPSMRPAGEDGEVALKFAYDVPSSSSIAGCHIDNLRCSSDGVWYPDAVDLQMSWRTDGLHIGQGSAVNVFQKVPRKWIAESFTARLPSKASTLQWALPMSHAVEPTRGNKALAQQNECPEWLDKREFLAFCSLRAFPCQQLRRLCIALRDRTLPLREPAVLALVRQLLGQVGELTPESELLWRTDMTASDILATLHEEVARLVDEHAQKPRDHEAIPLLAELAAFVSQWHLETAELSRDLARGVLVWAREASTQMLMASPEERDRLRASRTLFNAYAVLCHATLELSKSDVCRLCSGMAELRRGLLFGADSLEPSLTSLQVLCESVMAARIHEIIKVIEEDRSICTEVLKAIVDPPENLGWEQESFSGACYGARCGRDLYSINVLRGVVLINGCPPQRLPANITRHPMYRRVFENIEFDVAPCGNGASFRTTHQILGVFYEFASLPDGGILVYELPKEKKYHLQLISHTSLGEQVPVRLRKLHSHWFDRSQRTLLFRPVSFQERRVQWLLRVAKGELLQVPVHLPAQDGFDWHKSDERANQLDNLDRRLVLVPNSSLIAVLAKFEDPSFIHVFVRSSDPCRMWKIEFPRFGLTFNVGTDEVVSEDYAGFRLSEKQQLQDTLPDFTQYLVLRREHDLEASEVLLLVPDGPVATEQPVRISCSQCCGSELGVHQYKVHQRFGTLTAGSIEARLLLAALYLVAGSALPDQRTQMTAVENAMLHLRQCWVNRPLSLTESRKLQNILLLSKEHPALELLCRELDSSSKQLAFLHECQIGELPEAESHHDLAARYMQEVRSNANNPRRRLEACEERRCLGVRSAPRERQPESCEVELEENLFQWCVARFSELLADLSHLTGKPREDQGQVDEVPSFPLPEASGDCRLGQEMLQELKQSWNAHHRSEASREQLDTKAVLDPETYAKLWAECHDLGALTHGGIRAAFAAVPDINHKERARAFRVRKAGHLFVEPSNVELIQCALRPPLISTFNPFLSERSRCLVRSAILQLLEIYVMEDKLRRLHTLAKQKRVTGVLQELCVTRVWDVHLHPEWLAFEVESGIQIRPVQYKVAQQLLENPGNLVQLNMGEGKTRVIIPMLLLCWADGKRVVRITALTSLIDELFEYLHLHLCASTLARKVFVMPSHRQVELTPERITAMRHVMEYCQSTGGALLAAPEHRLSLQLKWHELHAAGEEELCGELDRLFDVETRELLDESDEVLRHKYQLIYSVGSPMPLPDGPTRWLVAGILLRILQEHWPRFAEILPPGAVQRGTDDGGCADEAAFVTTRLIPGPELDDVIDEFKLKLVDILFDDPPFELQWLSSHQDGHEEVKEFVCDPTRDMTHLPVDLPESRIAALLALRGFLGCGVLQHCLEKRHLVNFGINRKGKKRLAVPFRASRTPMERTEYGQPDCAILLTLLSYYYDGLARKEVKEAFERLLHSGPLCRESFYSGPGGWYAWSEKKIPKEDQTLLDSVEKLDLSNELQLEKLHEYFHRNMLVVTYWLNYVVFETETMQYPHKLVASAWHLADHEEGLVHGFSGTDDNHRVLPLQVQQHWLPELAGTNGKMMQLVLDNPTYHTLDPGMSIAKFAANRAEAAGVRALIDCGAFAAGLSNEEVARELLPRLASEQFDGVMFFASEWKEWVVLDRRGRILQRHRSPIQTQEAFVFFDEARSRGADVMLRQDAVALVTIGPNICKDKLLQAAGRMRMLGRGQGLEFVGTVEIRGKALESLSWSTQNGLVTSKELLWWVIQNTITATKEAFCEWGKQGAAFVTTKGKPQLAVFEDACDLQSAYAGAVEKRRVSDVINATVASFESRGGGTPTDPHSADLLGQIRARGKLYGSCAEVLCSVFEEECERELELQVDLEKEKEVERSGEKPLPESVWDFTAVFSATSLKDLEGVVEVMDLGAVTMEISALRDQRVTWPSSVKCTRNFAWTVQATNLDDVMRPVDMLIVLPSSDWLLVSQFEAEHLLRLFWARGLEKRVGAWNRPQFVHLVNYTYMVGDPNILPNLALQSPSEVPANSHPHSHMAVASCHPHSHTATRHPHSLSLPHMAVACVTTRIFMGEPSYCSDARELLRAALSSGAKVQEGLVSISPAAARKLVALRRMEAFFERSELQRQLLLLD